jgi:hypothetical protein
MSAATPIAISNRGSRDTLGEVHRVLALVEAKAARIAESEFGAIVRPSASSPNFRCRPTADAD